MGEVQAGRWTAEIEGDFVVFLIGARVNSPLGLAKAYLDFGGRRGMGHMLKYLMEDPEKGLLGFQIYSIVNVQYWRSFDALEAYVNELERESDRTQQLSEEQKALNFLKTIGTTGEIPQVRQLVLGLAAQNDQLQEQAGLRKLNNDLTNEAYRKQEELDQAIENFTGRVEIARKQALTARLEARLAAGEQFSPDELDKAVKGIAGINDETQKTVSFAQQIGDAFASPVPSDQRIEDID